MAIQSIEILRSYMTCEDPAVKNKYYNILESFWHKSEGDILTRITEDETSIRLDFTSGKYTVIKKLPTSVEISFVTNLQEALDGKVDKVPGKQLSSNDFTNELRVKLETLENYVHPEYHQISEVQNLQEALDGKVDKEAGKELSSNDYTDAEKSKLASIDAAHYGKPLQSIADLENLQELEITDKERRYVEDELSDYFYDAQATAGEIAPLDQTEGTGFWRKVSVGGETAVSIKTKYESNPDTNAYNNAAKTKLDGLRTNAENEALFGQKGGYEGTLQDLKDLIDNFQGFSGNYEDLSNKPVIHNYQKLNFSDPSETDGNIKMNNTAMNDYTSEVTAVATITLSSLVDGGNAVFKHNGSSEPTFSQTVNRLEESNDYIPSIDNYIYVDNQASGLIYFITHKS